MNKMFRRGFSYDLPLPMRLRWYSLSFLSGSVNAGAFLAVQRFVTHVTGFATLFGADLAQGHWTDAVTIVSVPFYFVAGAMISAFFVDRRLQHGKTPRYGLVMCLVSGCLGIAGLAGHLRAFGAFGNDLVLSKDYLLLALLSMASGLQNAAITTASNGVVRTTHLTGLTTDIGIAATRVLFPGQDHGRHVLERRNLRLKFWSVFAFVLGSVAGAILFVQVQYLGFFLPAAIAAYVAFEAIAPQREIGIRQEKLL